MVNMVIENVVNVVLAEKVGRSQVQGEILTLNLPLKNITLCDPVLLVCRYLNKYNCKIQTLTSFQIRS